MSDEAGSSGRCIESTQLRVFMLGGFKLEHDGRSLDARCTRAVQALLAFLILNRGRVHTREQLAELFWPDYRSPQAQKCLSTALWRARAVVEPERVTRGTFLASDALARVGFRNDESVWTDCGALEGAVTEQLRVPAERLSVTGAEALRCAVDSYAGDLLVGFEEDWVLPERERLRLLQLRGLQHLVQFHQARSEPEQALTLALRILAHDPLREDMHRAVMASHAQMGQRGPVAQQYRACCSVLRRELGLEPAAETSALYASLCSTSDVIDLRPGLRRGPRPQTTLRAELHDTLAAIDALRNKVQAALELVADAELEPKSARSVAAGLGTLTEE